MNKGERIKEKNKGDASLWNGEKWGQTPYPRVVDGKHDQLPEEAFYLVGTIDDAVAKAKRLADAAFEDSLAGVIGRMPAARKSSTIS